MSPLLPHSIRRGLVLSVAVSLLVIVWLNARSVTPSTLGLLRQANLLYLFLACATTILAWVAEAWRIQVLLRLSGDNVGLRRLVGIILATFFAAGVTPFASGQGPVQVYLLHREGVSVGRATAVLSLRLFLTVVVFTVTVPLLLLSVRLGISEQVHALANWGVIASFALAAAFLAFLLHPHAVAKAIHTFTSRHLAHFFHPDALDRLLDRLVAEVDEFTGTLDRLDGRRFALLVAAGLLTVVYWILYFAAAPLLLAAFARPFNPVRVIALQTVFFFLLSIVPIPGGSGVAELGFAQIFAHLLPAALVGVFVSLWRLLTYHLSLLTGAFAFMALLRRTQTAPSGGSSNV